MPEPFTTVVALPAEATPAMATAVNLRDLTGSPSIQGENAMHDVPDHHHHTGQDAAMFSPQSQTVSFFPGVFVTGYIRGGLQQGVSLRRKAGRGARWGAKVWYKAENACNNVEVGSTSSSTYNAR